MIFAATSALYAVLDRDDEHHAAARTTSEQLLDNGEVLLVTNYGVVEATALVQHRLGLEAVRVLASDVLPALDVHWMTEDDHRQAQNAHLAAARRPLSLVDCCSFHVMRSRMVRRAFAFDAHFSEQGFEVLPAL